MRIWSRETGSAAAPSRVSLLISILRLNLVLTYEIIYIYILYIMRFLPSSAAASIYLFKPPYAIGSVPSSLGHAIAYSGHSLPRVRQHRASSPEGTEVLVPGPVIYVRTYVRSGCSVLFEEIYETNSIMGQQNNVGEKPTVILFTYTSRHAGTSDKAKTKQKQCII